MYSISRLSGRNLEETLNTSRLLTGFFKIQMLVFMYIVYSESVKERK